MKRAVITLLLLVSCQRSLCILEGGEPYCRQGKREVGVFGMKRSLTECWCIMKPAWRTWEMQ